MAEAEAMGAVAITEGAVATAEGMTATAAAVIAAEAAEGIITKGAEMRGSPTPALPEGMKITGPSSSAAVRVRIAGPVRCQSQPQATA